MSNQRSLRPFPLGVECFANAILYSLSDIQQSERTVRGIRIPINEEVWQAVFGMVFREKYKHKKMQLLQNYRGYFNRGEHSMGYDKNGKRDFGLGQRVKVTDRGNKGKVGDPITDDPSRKLLPGRSSTLKAGQVIGLAMDYFERHYPKKRKSERANAFDWYQDYRKGLNAASQNGKAPRARP